jgi:DNA-binding GntR family transcriptional regulator
MDGMSDKLSPVDISTLQERVYLRLREALYQGQFAAGETVTIRGLASALGTSAMPVREALQRLVAERALVQLPSRSVKVAPFTPEMFSELISIRITIEGMAAGRAALNATPALADKLEMINKEMKAAIAAGFTDGTGEVLDANKRFHFTLYEAAKMPQLLEIISGMWLRTGPYLRAAYRSTGASYPFSKGTLIHDRVIEAVRLRDQRRASTNLALDIWATARWFKAHHLAEINYKEETAPNRIAL